MSEKGAAPLEECIRLYGEMIARPRRWDTPEGALNCCGAAAWAFETTLIQFDIPFSCYAVALDTDDGIMFHVMTKVGDLAIDWTARQFLPGAPFPAFFTQRDFDELGWREITEDEAKNVIAHESIHRKWIADGEARDKDGVPVLS